MKERINIQELHPKAYAGMVALERTLHNNELNQTHLDLIKIRASQINGCAFCISMHTKDALKHGETAQRIFLLDAWRETDHFSLAEQIILAITEEITHISPTGIKRRNVFQRGRKIFRKLHRSNHHGSGNNQRLESDCYQYS